MNRRTWFVDMLSGFMCTLLGWATGKKSQTARSISKQPENISATEKKYPSCAKIWYRGHCIECSEVQATLVSQWLSEDFEIIGEKLVFSVTIWLDDFKHFGREVGLIRLHDLCYVQTFAYEGRFTVKIVKAETDLRSGDVRLSLVALSNDELRRIRWLDKGRNIPYMV